MEIAHQQAASNVSAPHSPRRSFSLNSSMQYFYSAPSSPLVDDDGVNATFGDFEFETSKKFRLEGMEFETSQNYETMAPMAFADELFMNGQVAPLKLPPRLIHSAHGSNQNSTATSPRSPFRILFGRPMSTWNDEFDPFAVALEKVKEEKRGKGQFHRRARSLSPFRTTTPRWSGDSEGLDQKNKNSQGGPLEPMHHRTGPDLKEIDNKKPSQMEELSLKGPPPPPKPMGLPFGKRVRPLKVGQTEGTTTKPISNPIQEEKTEASGGEENRKKKMKGYIGRYGSFGKEKTEVKLKEQVAALWKRLGFKGKENASKNTKKEVFKEPKMEISPYRPRLTLCLSFRMESSKNYMYSP